MGEFIRHTYLGLSDLGVSPPHRCWGFGLCPGTLRSFVFDFVPMSDHALFFVWQQTILAEELSATAGGRLLHHLQCPSRDAPSLWESPTPGKSPFAACRATSHAHMREVFRWHGSSDKHVPEAYVTRNSDFPLIA